MATSFKRITLVLACYITVVVIWSATALFLNHDVSVYRENGPIENLQAATLAIGLLLYLAGIRLACGPDKLIHACCALLCYAFTLRELDVERLDVPVVLKMVGGGTGRNMTIAAASIFLAAMAALKPKTYARAAALFLKSRAGKLLLLAGLLLLTGDLFEKGRAITHHVYFEEILELCGYSLIVLAAAAALTDNGHRQTGE